LFGITPLFCSLQHFWSRSSLSHDKVTALRRQTEPRQWFGSSNRGDFPSLFLNEIGTMKFAYWAKAGCLAMVMVGTLACCRRRPSQPAKGEACDVFGEQICDSKQSELICMEGVWEPLACRGMLGCSGQGSSVLCDQSRAKEGERCLPRSTPLCSVDGQAMLSCSHGTIKKTRECLGVQGCQLDGEQGFCDQTVAKEGTACIQDSLQACDRERKHLLVCSQSQWTLANPCLGTATCHVELSYDGTYQAYCGKEQKLTIPAQKRATLLPETTLRETELGPAITLDIIEYPTPFGKQVVWAYLPNVGRQAKLPAVFIPASGSSMLSGAPLSLTSRTEHLPFVQAGYVVIAYSLSGWVDPKGKTESPATIQAYTQFVSSKAGIENLKTVKELALNLFPFITRHQLFLAGYDSGASHVLVAGAHVKGFKAIAALSPYTDLTAYFKQGATVPDTSLYPNFDQFLSDYDPLQYCDVLITPTLLFQAEDDASWPWRTTELYAKRLRKSNAHMKWIHVPSGGHYDAVLEHGIPATISWFDRLRLQRKAL
jgi:dienelactone hydrolase